MLRPKTKANTAGSGPRESALFAYCGTGAGPLLRTVRLIVMVAERSEVKEFFARLHRVVFKPRGFIKSNRTFTRDEGTYAVAFRFQGSRWNDPTTPWVFYLNAGIRFQGIPRREPDKDFPTIHSWIRVGSTLSSSAEPEYHLTAAAIDELVRQIERVVEDGIKYFTARHEWLFRKYSTRPFSYLSYLDHQLMGE